MPSPVYAVYAAGVGHKARVGAAVVFGLLAVGSCGVETANKGGSCTRSTECTSGLACVRGRCTDDLSSVASQSKVPMLMPSPAGEDAGH